jgi:hypothetical protein
MGDLRSVRDAERDGRGACWRDHVSRSGHVQADQDFGCPPDGERKEGGWRRPGPAIGRWWRCAHSRERGRVTEATGGEEIEWADINRKRASVSFSSSHLARQPRGGTVAYRSCIRSTRASREDAGEINVTLKRSILLDG